MPQQSTTVSATTKRYMTVVYFQNMSDTEPESELEIRRDDSLLFTGTVHYNGIEDDWNNILLKTNTAPHRFSIVHKNSGIRLDTVVTSSDTLTHVFLTYGHHKPTKTELIRFKKQAHDAEEEKYILSLFDKPRRFSVLVMSGRISIP